MTTAAARALTIIASGYARCNMERVYDAIVDRSEAGAQLRGLTPGQKRAVELALYAAMAVVDARMSEANPLTILLKQILGDAGPELARRMLAETASADLRAPFPLEPKWPLLPGKGR